MRDKVAPLLQPDEDEASAVRFDAHMYGIELAYLVGEKHIRKPEGSCQEGKRAVAGVANIRKYRRSQG